MSKQELPQAAKKIVGPGRAGGVITLSEDLPEVVGDYESAKAFDLTPQQKAFIEEHDLKPYWAHQHKVHLLQDQFGYVALQRDGQLDIRQGMVLLVCRRADWAARHAQRVAAANNNLSAWQVGPSNVAGVGELGQTLTLRGGPHDHR